MSLCVFVCLSILGVSPSHAIFFWPLNQDQPGSSPLTGSTRQQTVGRINRVADRRNGDEDEDKYEDEDEILSYAVLLTASVERFGVSCMRDFFMELLKLPKMHQMSDNKIYQKKGGLADATFKPH